MSFLDGIFEGKKQQLKIEKPTKKEGQFSLKDALNEVKKVEIPKTRTVKLTALLSGCYGCGGDFVGIEFTTEVPFDSPFEDGMFVSESQVTFDTEKGLKLK